MILFERIVNDGAIKLLEESGKTYVRKYAEDIMAEGGGFCGTG